MLSLFALVNKHFWKSITGPIFCFILPSLLLFFVGGILGYTFVMPGGLAFPILTVGLVFMPQAIFEFKSSSLLKRIALTKIDTKKFFFVIFTYNFIVIVASIVIQYLFSFLVFYNNLYEAPSTAAFIVMQGGIPKYQEGQSYLQVLESIEWGGFIYSIALMITLTMMIGFAFASIARSSLFIVSAGISFVLITMFLAPTILPTQMIAKSEEVKLTGFIWPLKYAMGLLIESWNGPVYGDNIVGEYQLMPGFNNITGSTIWDINKNYVIFNAFGDIRNEIGGIVAKNLNYNYFTMPEKIANLVMPYVFIFIFLGITASKFSWNTRSSKKINFKKIANKQLNLNPFVKGSSDSEYLIEANNIRKEFNVYKSVLVANDDINIKFKKYQNVAIIGANGAGKTTFIEMLLGINKPDGGSFVYNYEYKDKFNELLGVQFQDSSYPFGLKCKDIILFFKSIYKLKMTNEELDVLIEEFGIKKFYNKNASSLSGGQQQRLNLLLSVLHKPKLIILDELSTGLDIKIRNKIKAFIKDYAKANDLTLVVISHDMNEVDFLCDRIIVFKDGKIVEDQEKEAILKTNNNLDDFINQYLEH
ncbi:MAG: ATP-binding cassette domain-containing protein [Mycoplasmoidaceae bacterium]